MSEKISQLSAIANASMLPGVIVPVVDPNDTSTAPAGTGGSDKRMTLGQLLPGAVWPSGSTAGVKDRANVLAAIASDGAATLMPGTFYGASTVAYGLGQQVRGSGKAVTRWNNVGSTPAFDIDNTGAYDGDTPAELTGLRIDGSGASSGAEGYRAGDIEHLEIDAWVSSFTGGNIGAHILNDAWWTEQAIIRGFFQNCDNAFKLDLSGAGTQSFDRCVFDLWFDQQANQNGVIIGGSPGAVLLGGTLRMHGNWQASASAVTSSLLSFTAQFGNILNTRLEWDIECDGTGAHTPQTIKFFDSTTVITGCDGNIELGSGPKQFTASNNNGNFWFDGPVSGDASLLTKVALPPTSYFANSGFPTGVSGEIVFELARGDGMVFCQFQLTIASGTTLTNGETIVTGLPAWAFGPNNRFVAINLNGTFVPWEITTAGTVTYNGPTQTLGSTSFPFGQQTYSNSL